MIGSGVAIFLPFARPASFDEKVNPLALLSGQGIKHHQEPN